MGSAYVRMLAAIVLAYAVTIGFGEAVAGGPGRLLVLGYLLWDALRLRRQRSGRRLAVLVSTAVVVAAAILGGLAAPLPVASGFVGAVSLCLTAGVIAIVASAVRERHGVDTQTVLGVLSVYLLLALLFASLHQLFAAFNPDGYLHGVQGLPSAADQLYFSVITLATVGYGDIVPASSLARAVVVVEAMTGQLYLVSVVAAVVGGWHRAPGS